ncbi:GNAT family N-acetyltransferase [Salinivibrio kushneri]|uniref:GNAT family N-acetyltransferase n=1 Tax=Salinivibrio kushneri TaxID=1908198 RepID=A0AA47KKG7_9GAMM|nr:GNAT family N-acetyltransferase [Salinivibrio kushneri]WBA08529.1 GNAT family N-acetyltransferase [Salinivibrio kushneri]
MDNYHIHPLEPLRFPLVARFYKTYYPPGKPKKDEHIWVVDGPSGLCGAVRFQQRQEYQLLTGMLLHPQLRGSGLSHQLLDAVRPLLAQRPSFCLAFRPLTTLYVQHGFNSVDTQALPEELAMRYQSYCHSGKDLVAMQYTPKA